MTLSAPHTSPSCMPARPSSITPVVIVIVVVVCSTALMLAGVPQDTAIGAAAAATALGVRVAGSFVEVSTPRSDG